MSELSPWREVGAGVFVAVAEPAAVTVGLVVGTDSALVVDTGSTPDQGRAIRAAVAKVTSVPISTAVVTHWHYDHAFGLAAFDDVLTVGHESVARRLEATSADATPTDSTSADAAASEAEVTRLAQTLGFDRSRLVVPHRQIAVATAVDLGGRRVEIAHLGRGHTDGDLVVVVGDADIVFAGDLVESAGPPWFGDDSFPHEWAATLDGVIGLMTQRSRLVPGHGPDVDREFVFNARGEVGAMSGEIRRLVESGVPAADALRSGSWPYPEANVAAGVARGYSQLVGSGVTVHRTLPLA